MKITMYVVESHLRLHFYCIKKVGNIMNSEEKIVELNAKAAKKKYAEIAVAVCDIGPDGTFDFPDVNSNSRMAFHTDFFSADYLGKRLREEFGIKDVYLSKNVEFDEDNIMVACDLLYLKPKDDTKHAIAFFVKKSPTKGITSINSVFAAAKSRYSYILDCEEKGSAVENQTRLNADFTDKPHIELTVAVLTKTESGSMIFEDKNGGENLIFHTEDISVKDLYAKLRSKVEGKVTILQNTPGFNNILIEVTGDTDYLIELFLNESSVVRPNFKPVKTIDEILDVVCAEYAYTIAVKTGNAIDEAE